MVSFPFQSSVYSRPNIKGYLSVAFNRMFVEPAKGLAPLDLRLFVSRPLSLRGCSCRRRRLLRPALNRGLGGDDQEFPILDRRSLRVEPRREIKEPLRARCGRRLLESLEEVIRRYRLVIERRLHCQPRRVNACRQFGKRHLIPQLARAAAVCVTGVVRRVPFGERRVEELAEQ